MSKVHRSDETLNSIPELSLTTVLESIPDAVVVAEVTTGEIVAVNEAAGDLFDCQPATLVGLHRRALHPTEDTTAYEEAFHRAFENEQVERLQDGSPVYIETRAGNHVPVEINSKRIQHQDQTFVLGVFRDISSRIERQQQLQETTTRLETLLDAAPLPIAVLDKHGHVQSWNQASEETFGYNAAEVVGEPYPLFTDMSHFTDLLERVLGGGILDGYEAVLRTKDGSRRQIELYARPLYDDDEITGVIGAAVDITDRKRRRHGLEVLHRVLRHDLRNKLTVIQGHASALMSEPDSDPKSTEKAAEQIVAATDDLAELSTQVAQSRLLGDEPGAETDSLEITELRETVESLPADTADSSIDIQTDGKAAMIPEPGQAAVRRLLTHVTAYMTHPAIDVVFQVLDTDVHLTIEGDEPLLSESHRQLISNGAETKLNHGLGLDIVKVYLTLIEIGGDIELVGDPIPETSLRVTLPRLNE